MTDDTAAAELANEIRTGDDGTLWTAFGREIQDAAGKTDAPFVAIGLSVNPDAFQYARHELPNLDDADGFRSAIGVTHRQSAGTWDAATDLPIHNAADATIVVKASRGVATVDRVRELVADAIDG